MKNDVPIQRHSTGNPRQIVRLPPLYIHLPALFGLGYRLYQIAINILRDSVILTAVFSDPEHD